MSLVFRAIVTSTFNNTAATEGGLCDVSVVINTQQSLYEGQNRGSSPVMVSEAAGCVGL